MSDQSSDKRIHSYYQGELVCPVCHNRDINVPSQPEITFDIASGRSLTIEPLGLLNPKDATIADRINEYVHDVIADFQAGVLTETQVLDQYRIGYRIPVQITADCRICGAQLVFNTWTSTAYAMYSEFWERLRHEIDALLNQALKIDLATVRAFTQIPYPEHAIVERAYDAAPGEYGDLKRLKDLTIRIPADKGGGDFHELISVLFLSIIGSALYDALKAGGQATLSSLRSLYSRREFKKHLRSALDEKHFESLAGKLNDRQIAELLKGPLSNRLSLPQKKKLISKAVRKHAKEFRRKLLDIIEKK